jgi:hypothetical protein
VKKTQTNRLLNLNVSTFSILLLSIILYVIPSTKYIGMLSIIILLYLSIFYFITHLKNIRITKTFIIWIIYTCYGFFVLLTSFSYKATYIY